MVIAANQVLGFRSDDRHGGGGGRYGPRWYILDDNHQAVPTDMMTAAIWMEAEVRKPRRESKRVVGFTLIPGYGYVSTIFLSLDHAFFGDTPILFECMTFKRPAKHPSHMQFRCATWVQARALHFVVTNVMRKYGKAAMRAYHSGDKREISRIDRKIYEAV